MGAAGDGTARLQPSRNPRSIPARIVVGLAFGCDDAQQTTVRLVGRHLQGAAGPLPDVAQPRAGARRLRADACAVELEAAPCLIALRIAGAPALRYRRSRTFCYNASGCRFAARIAMRDAPRIGRAARRRPLSTRSLR